LLLPFEAEPKAVGQLRHASWGAPHLTDAAELAVSELATNVIRHVGEGTPAALVMEARDDRIRVELHDTGKSMPHCGQAGPDEISGRGLALVAAVSDGWFALPTPGGKAVCCEFATTEPALATRPAYDPRAVRGCEAVELYALQQGGTGTRPVRGLRGVESFTTDLITDLLHWLAANGRDPDTVLDHAQMRFEAEREEVGE
jgi:anti-sigma regulatory factor (Ser/Thr protein kinase)